MSSDSSTEIDPIRHPAGHEAVAPPTPARSVIAQVPVAPPPLPPKVEKGKPAPPERWSKRWWATLPLAWMSRLFGWYREDGFWYVTSTVVHAVGLFSLALISMAIPSAIGLVNQDVPTFEAVEEGPAEPPPVARFEVGDAPLEPTELKPEMFTWTEAKPIGGQTERYYDDSPDFEEAGGGMADAKGQNLGGLGGFSVANLPGPAGRGGVGMGKGLGTNAGWGGAGEGFGQRGKGHRDAMLGAYGGTRASERAVLAALNWLYRHQTQQGKWSIDYRSQCKGDICTGPGMSQSDAAATAMGLLPFLAAGQTHKSKGAYQQTVAKGLNWLIKQQKQDGDLAGGCPQPMYAHGLATIALCEAYGMSRDEHVGRAARLAVAFVQRAQNESTGGWRYLPGDAGDTSVFGWQIMALKSAQMAGIPVDSEVFDKGKRWLNSVARGEHMGLYSYQPYQQVTPTMTAVGMLGRQYMGIDPKDPSILEGKTTLLENLPDNEARDTYYWYYATLVMHNFADADWDTWNRKMRRTLIETQVKEGCATGSWDPSSPSVDKWSPNGGRLMTTSFSALILEVYYRYLPLFRTDSLIPEKAPMGFSKGEEKEEE